MADDFHEGPAFLGGFVDIIREGEGESQEGCVMLRRVRGKAYCYVTE